MPQRERLREFFKARPNQEIPTNEIWRLGIMQYGRVIHELRGDGMDIINIDHGIVNDQRHTAFKYVPAQYIFNGNQAEFTLAKEV